jgi:diguanylate cyclase (GGDEF)-like protein/PAS domain S-box-containing protein
MNGEERSPRVLIVEDDPGIALLETEALEEIGCTVDQVSRGDAVLVYLQAQRPDLVLLDYSLPDMTGIHLLERVAERFGRVPTFIVTTGAGDEHVAVDLMRRGAVNYLIKDHGYLDLLPAAVQRALEEQRLNRRLAQLEKRARLAAMIIDTTTEGIYVTNARHQIVEANHAFEEITGYGKEEVMGITPERLLPGHKSDQAASDRVFEALAKNGHWQGEMPMRRKNGELFTGWFNISNINGPDKPPVFVTLFSDISTVKEKAEHLDFIAHHDPLTKLPNRLLFQARLRHSLDKAKRTQGGLGLVYLDLDHFKEVNDTLGHAVGDDLLCLLAERMQRQLRAEDTLARLGGDEFVCLIEEARSDEDLQRVVNQLLGLFPHPMPTPDGVINVSASIGGVLFPRDGTEAALLLERADQAMYAAKEAGRNTYRAFPDTL